MCGCCMGLICGKDESICFSKARCLCDMAHGNALGVPFGGKIGAIDHVFPLYFGTFMLLVGAFINVQFSRVLTGMFITLMDKLSGLNDFFLAFEYLTQANFIARLQSGAC